PDPRRDGGRADRLVPACQTGERGTPLHQQGAGARPPREAGRDGRAVRDAGHPQRPRSHRPAPAVPPGRGAGAPLPVHRRGVQPDLPEHHWTEVQAAAKAAERDESLLLFADTIADLTSGLGCSTIVVEKERSMTGGPLFGRNFDWLPTKGIAEHTLIVVYKGE